MRVNWSKQCLQSFKKIRPAGLAKAESCGALLAVNPKAPELTCSQPGAAAQATELLWPDIVQGRHDMAELHSISKDMRLYGEWPLRAVRTPVGALASRMPISMCQMALSTAARSVAPSSGDLPSSQASTKAQGRPPSQYAAAPRPRYAIVRGVPNSFGGALTREKQAPESAINVDLAREQHATLVSILKELVGEVIELPADERHPDCPFVEDTAVVVGKRTLSTRIGAPSREGECLPVAQTLRELGLTVAGEIRAPATLDGGDVLRIGGNIFVGLSTRTNKEGVVALKEAFPDKEVHAIPLGNALGLHLKSVMTPIGGDYVAVEANKVTDEIFQSMHSFIRTVMAVPVPTVGGANTCLVGDSLLYSSALVSPEIANNFSAAGAKTIAVDISEFHKADGGITCLSILIE